jgi:metal-responsive CopG/Arc/MetJ family transcriptional regulator
MGREKITISLSTKCLELIDTYAETTGFEARSRVIEEAIFSICDLLSDKTKLDGILDRFKRFPITKYPKEAADAEVEQKRYRTHPQ